MHKKCTSCPRLGETCGGAGFYLLTSEEMVQWCKQRKAFLNLSNSKIAKAANMPIGTVDTFFASTHTDFRFDTVRCILTVLIGDKRSEDLCQPLGDAEKARIKSDNEHMLNEKIRLETALQREQEQYKENIEHLKQDVEYLKATNRTQKRLVYILGIALFITLSIIIIALYIDSRNLNIGFFWRA